MSKKAYEKCPYCGEKTTEAIIKLFEDDCWCENCGKTFASAPLKKGTFMCRVMSLKQEA